MPFVTDLKVKPIRHSNKRELLSALVYIDNEVGAIVAPTGFITDYATIPKIVPRYLINSDSSTIRDASVIHDFLYSKSTYTRKVADQVLYRAMLDLGSSVVIAKTIYYVLRVVDILKGGEIVLQRVH